jgi:hypothetical protein
MSGFVIMYSLVITAVAIHTFTDKEKFAYKEKQSLAQIIL